MFSVHDGKLRIRINIAVPLSLSYRGGGVALFRANNGKSEVLLGLRANNPCKGSWSFPGGGAGYGEKLLSAAFREFKEETGVRLYGGFITRTGVFKIKKPFFEWETLLVETSQIIDAAKLVRAKHGRGFGGEFVSMRWAALPELGGMKLHKWVSDAVKVYLGGGMAEYCAKPPAGIRYIKPAREAFAGHSCLEGAFYGV